MDWAVDLTVTHAKVENGTLGFDVNVINSHTGHTYPSGVTQRNVVLLVEATQSGTILTQNLTMVATRSLEAGHPPFSNLYESLVFYACCTAFVYIIFEFIYNFRVIGALASVLSMLILLYVTLQEDTIRPIMPALKSNWMLVHVVI